MIPWETKVHAIQQLQEEGSTMWLKNRERSGSEHPSMKHSVRCNMHHQQANQTRHLSCYAKISFYNPNALAAHIILEELSLELNQ